MRFRFLLIALAGSALLGACSTLKAVGDFTGVTSHSGVTVSSKQYDDMVDLHKKLQATGVPTDAKAWQDARKQWSNLYWHIWDYNNDECKQGVDAPHCDDTKAMAPEVNKEYLAFVKATVARQNAPEIEAWPLPLALVEIDVTQAHQFDPSFNPDKAIREALQKRAVHERNEVKTVKGYVQKLAKSGEAKGDCYVGTKMGVDPSHLKFDWTPSDGELFFHCVAPQPFANYDHSTPDEVELFFWSFGIHPDWNDRWDYVIKVPFVPHGNTYDFKVPASAIASKFDYLKSHEDYKFRSPWVMMQVGYYAKKQTGVKTETEGDEIKTVPVYDVTEIATGNFFFNVGANASVAER